ncbi:hypothetical protein XvhCFBP2543_21755, partial [Xanthomonas vasicola]
SVANTGSFSTPVQTSRPCGRWVVGVFQGRLVMRQQVLPLPNSRLGREFLQHPRQALRASSL